MPRKTRAWSISKERLPEPSATEARNSITWTPDSRPPTHLVAAARIGQKIFVGNRRLYSTRGLERWRDSLTPGGVLAVWSAGNDPSFTARLRRVGFQAEAERVRVRVGKGERHTIFLAR